MTLEELRVACERAGMNVKAFRMFKEHDELWYAWNSQTAFDPFYDEHCEWIKARCASLLVAKVRERDEFMGDMEHRLLIEHPDQVLMAATDEQRIRAAMAVLGEG